MKEIDPLNFLKAVYMNADLPLSVRMRAAIELLPFTHPKLAVTALVNEQNFAEILDRRLARIEQMNTITNGNGREPVEVKPYVNPQTQTQTIEAPKPLPRLADRRFRRM